MTCRYQDRGTGKSFSYKGAMVWNDIRNNIGNVESAALFTFLNTPNIIFFTFVVL